MYYPEHPEHSEPPDWAIRDVMFAPPAPGETGSAKADLGQWIIVRPGEIQRAGTQLRIVFDDKATMDKVFQLWWGGRLVDVCSNLLLSKIRAEDWRVQTLAMGMDP